jgi:hypothetical protein
MKIEYLESGAEDCPLIRIYGNQMRELKSLHHHVSSLCAGDRKYLKVHELPGFVGVEECELTFHTSKRDKGISQTNEQEFTCNLEIESWCHIEKQIEALVESSSEGYQWLNESSNISLLLSTNKTGAW